MLAVAGEAGKAAPATQEFTTPSPPWQSGWLLALAGAVLAAAVASAVWTALRYRLRRDLEIERIRARIAEDLHDDIGSSLTRIAILAEVARQKVGEGEAATLLSEIAETTRALVGSMSDAIWSIDSKQDDLRPIVAPMRAFATDVLDGKGISWTFDAPAEPGARLAPEIRRELFLIFKEAVTNVARHSGARTAALKLALEANRVVLEVEDDGIGIEAQPAHDLHSSLHRGRGLLSMQVRAMRKGGELTIAPAAEKGTRLVLVLPLRGKSR